RIARTSVRRNASIGANATILPGVEIGEQAMIGAGAVVTRSVPDYAIVVGNPATIIGYTNTNVPQPERSASVTGGDPVTTKSMVPGVELLTLRMAADMRGKLAVGQVGDGLPFVPQRMFMVYDVPSRETRGEHAHRECHQLLMCVHGQCVAVADDGRKR
uniref:WxcM-like domain-containing protein n=1 Tax=Pseudomonas sp. EA_15y_Pfl1_P102 TaxID=3088685 RepID=UPI0030DC1474